MDDDLFESALNLEQQHCREGYEDGIMAGRHSGRAEGRALGLQKGFEVGHEVGFYSGCCQVWRQLQAHDPALLSQRVDRSIAALEELAAAFPLSSPQDERLQEMMDALRGKFKALTAMLGVADGYAPPEQQQQQQQQAGGGRPATIGSMLDF